VSTTTPGADPLTWRDGACLEEKGKPPTSAPLPPDVDLDDLGAGSAQVHSIARLTLEKGTGDDLTRFQAKVNALAGQETQILILRLETQTDPLVLWELHRELDRRGIPPAQRWPANRDTLQAEFIAVLADLFWLATRYPDQALQPVFKNWLPLFKLPPDSEAWQTKAYFFYRNLSTTNRARHATKALALTKGQRQQLLMFPTAPMLEKRRRYLGQDRAGAIRQALHSEAVANPYKAKASDPEKDAGGRETLWRVFVLSGYNPTETTRVYQLITGSDGMTRQGISKRIATIKKALKKHCL
jgi:hypothetical protein